VPKPASRELTAFQPIRLAQAMPVTRADWLAATERRP
jgi:hypothetical protein